MVDWKIPQLNSEKCVVCGICVNVCPQAVIEMQARSVVFARPQDCTYCGACEESCPHGALVCSYEIGWA